MAIVITAEKNMENTCRTAVQMVPREPVDCLRIPDSSLSSPNPSFLVMHTLGCSKWWLKYLNHCYPCGRAILSCRFLASTWLGPGYCRLLREGDQWTGDPEENLKLPRKIRKEYWSRADSTSDAIIRQEKPCAERKRSVSGIRKWHEMEETMTQLDHAGLTSQYKALALTPRTNITSFRNKSDRITPGLQRIISMIRKTRNKIPNDRGCVIMNKPGIVDARQYCLSEEVWVLCESAQGVTTVSQL